MSRSDARVEARLRELCGLGLSGPQLAPLLFAELQAAVPFFTGTYLWFGPEGIVDWYITRPETGPLVRLYSERYFSGLEALIWATTAETVGTERGPHHLDEILRVPKAAYRPHPIYNEILRPGDCHTFIRTLVLDDDKPVGAFHIARAAHERDFDAHDLRLVARLEPFIAHALSRHDAPARPDGAEVDADTGLAVLDSAGRLCWLSASVRELLAMACGAPVVADVALPLGLQHAVQALISIARGAPDAGVPEWRTRNAWGSFDARVFWLEPASRGESMIGVELRRRVPQRLRIAEAVRELGLPQRQAQVCSRLASEESETAIAQQLGVTRNTVVYHRRQIYNRLGIDSRAQLVDALLNGGDPRGRSRRLS
jgi:DNA-binding CsgD family transcriptional regulator